MVSPSTTKPIQGYKSDERRSDIAALPPDPLTTLFTDKLNPSCPSPLYPPVDSSIDLASYSDEYFSFVDQDPFTDLQIEQLENEIHRIVEKSLLVEGSAPEMPEKVNHHKQLSSASVISEGLNKKRKRETEPNFSTSSSNDQIDCSDWGPEEDKQLLKLALQLEQDWDQIAQKNFNGKKRTALQCNCRFEFLKLSKGCYKKKLHPPEKNDKEESKCARFKSRWKMDPQQKYLPASSSNRDISYSDWTPEEDVILCERVSLYQQNWSKIAASDFNGKKRNHIQCRSRYKLITHNNKPANSKEISYTEWEPKEDRLLFERASLYQFDWHQVAATDFYGKKRSDIQCQTRYILIKRMV